MHEMSLMDSMLAIAREQLQPYRVARVNEIVLKIGRLANVLPDALGFAFEALSADTVFAGARLTQEVLPFRARCQECGAAYASMEIPPVCPDCAAHTADILSGTEVFLDSIDFEQAADESLI